MFTGEALMTDENSTWENFYNRTRGREPRQLLLDALERFPEQTSLHAIDLGCGDGTETALLLSRGWSVLAIDGEISAIRRLIERVPEDQLVRLQTRVEKFEEVTLPPTDLVHASLSLPFCHPDHFPAVWDKVVTAVRPGGRFAGQFFGPRDSWANEKDMTFHTEEHVRGLFDSFEIEFFHERDEDGPVSSGTKHWHIFTVIARKI